MVFAAGAGTRMAPITDYCPKPLIHVSGKPLIRHALDPAFELGMQKIVVNTNYKADQMTAYLDTLPVGQIHETERLETGGGLKNAIPRVGTGPVVTSNSDAVWHGANPYETLLENWDGDEMECLILLAPKANAQGHKGTGDFQINAGYQISRGCNFIYTGVQIINTNCVSKVADKVFSMNIVWDQLIARQTLFGVVYEGQWCDVGQPSSIKTARDMVALDV